VCGIAGVLALGERPPDPDWARVLLAALGHRGPDGQGVFCEGRVLLAHTRLAIIDPGPGGDQPMRSADGRFVIVQNGEIYNHRELAPELEDTRPLASRSDTEVLLELLARDGRAALPRLRGMFAFALWDRTGERLLLARDRIGKKPLLTVRTSEFFAFASEAAALLRLPFVRARLDREALADWLRLLYVPAPHTLLEGIRKLPAASTLEVTPEGADTTPARWWTLPAPDPEARPDAAWFAALDHELVEATRLRTVSDVPIGLFLSGGIDSNVVLEALSRTGHRPIHAFTLGFAGLPDERALARAGARRLADQHTELVIDPDLARELDGILAQFGDPLADSAVVTTALLARAAARHVKVILNGDGGDELFAGYPRYRFARRADLARDHPAARALLAWRAGGRCHEREALAALDAGRPMEAARALGSVWTQSGVAELLADGWPQGRDGRLPHTPGTGLTEALFAWDAHAYLPDDLLVKVDVASMAHGLENRSPLLDHRLFERVATLPPARRASAFVTKPLLRRHARGRVAPAVLRAPKRGFALPLDAWLSGPLAPWVDDLLARPGVTAPLFRPGAVRHELEAFRAGCGGPVAPYRLWALAVLEWWVRHFDVAIGA
jgi:asparagine synthase (glutamine-hydrolysing)